MAFIKNFNDVTEQTLPVVRSLEGLRYAGLSIVAATSEFILISAESAMMSEAQRQQDGEDGRAKKGEQIAEGFELFLSALTDYNTLVTQFGLDGAACVDTISCAGQELNRVGRELIEIKKKTSLVRLFSRPRKASKNMKRTICRSLMFRCPSI